MTTIAELAERLARRLTRPPEQPPGIPHCNGRHGPDADEHGTTCEWCDALTSLITAVRRLEARTDYLQREVNVLRGRPAGDPPPAMPSTHRIPGTRDPVDRTPVSRDI